jgi:DNA primase
MITNDVEIKAAASGQIIDIITRLANVSFSRSGSNYVCLSPFEDEKTPSFVVSPRKQIFKCFSSGKGGDITKFVMEYKGLTYPEALELLAEHTNTIIDYGTGNREQTRAEAAARRDTKEKMVAAIAKSHDFYRSITTLTPDSETGMVRIAGKDYDPSVLDYWGVVCAGDFQSLSGASRTWLERDMLIDCGLLSSKNNQHFYDFFHHRVLFPLYNLYGNIIGYNGRVYEATPPTPADKKDPPKYINSSDSLLYSKGAHVYGQFQNSREISRLSVANIVEGPTDVIQLYQYGIKIAVASSGTAFTLDQARSIAHDADQVIIMYDGDAPGIKATRKTIETCILAQLDVRVRSLPDGHDPASYLDAKRQDFMDSMILDTDTGALISSINKQDITTANARAYAAESLLSIPAIDAIEYYAMNEYPDIKIADLSNTQKAGLLLSVTKLISYINDQTTRDQYAVTIGKVIGNTTAVMKSNIQDRIDERQEAKNRLTAEQEQERMLYGIYRDGNKYVNGAGTNAVLSTFVINPLYLVTGSQNVHRVFEITNTLGISFALKMHSDELLGKREFSKKVESLGYFILEAACKDEHYTKIKKMMFANMENVLAIDTLGLHRAGFYAFSNGIVEPDGKFQNVDEYGIVKYGEKKYFLPTFSKIGKLDEDIEDDNDVFEKFFVFRTDDEINIKYIINGYKRLFGANAMIALSHYFLTVFMDVVFEKQKFTPILNIFGPPGSGKSYMAELLMMFYGSITEDYNPVHCVTSTVSSFFRTIAMAHNASFWYEEFGNEVDPIKNQGIKQFYNHEARTLSDKNDRKKTFSTRINGSCILTGQIMPGALDPALPERLVSIYTAPYQREETQDKFARRFEERGKTGVFTSITAQLFSWRPFFKQHYAKIFDGCVSLISSKFTATAMPKYRFVANYCSLMAMWIMVDMKIKEIDANYTSPFSDDEITSLIVERINEQARNIENIEETSEFFKMIEFLINQNLLTADFYACAYESEFKVVDPADPSKTINVTYDDIIRDDNGKQIGVGRKVIFIFMNHTHQLYSEHAKKQGLSRVINQNTMQHYLKLHRSYIGISKARRMNGHVRRCWAFDCSMLSNFDFKMTDFKVDPVDPFGSAVADPFGGMNVANTDVNDIFGVK